MSLRIALVGGPMYDGLYDHLSSLADVEVVVHADHPTLNRSVAERLSAGERIDLISTHGKYVPSQRRWLLPLDDLVAPSTIAGLAPAAVELCRFDGALLCVPRNIDVRVLWWRTDLLERAPVTWNDVRTADGAFGFTGRESGLFGLFYELLAASGHAPFDDGGHPTLDGPAAVGAAQTLIDLAAVGPDDLPHWHYDDVDRALLDGRVAMAAAWPGGYGAIAASTLADRLRPAPYPGGCSYSGSHGWAIPQTCGDVSGAVALVEQLAGTASGLVDARGGSMPANTEAAGALAPNDAVDAERIAITRNTIEDGMLTYPPLEWFPDIEDASWEALHHALCGDLPAAEAVEQMQRSAESVLARLAP